MVFIMRCDKVIEQLSAFLDGELTAEEALAVRRHLDSCAGCRRELEGLRRTLREVSGLPRVPAPPDLRAKVLRGLSSAPKLQEDAAEPELREKRLPLWRMFWPAAAAILIAVVIMLLGSPATRAKRSSTAGRVPQAAEAPAAARERGRETAAPLMEAQRGGSENAARLSPAPPRHESAQEGAGGGATGEQARTGEAGATNVAAPGMAFGYMRAGAVAAVPVETAIEQILLPSANPDAAFARARALAVERGWLAPEPKAAVLSDRVNAESPVPKMLLRLRRSQVPLLKDALAKAGLLAPAEAQPAAQPVAEVMAAPVPGGSGSSAAREGEGPGRFQWQSQGKALSPSAAPVAGDALRKAPDDAFVQVVLAFPRPGSAAPGAAAGGK